jgi:plasmid maintenance system antidote protein VapI
MGSADPLLAYNRRRQFAAGTVQACLAHAALTMLGDQVPPQLAEAGRLRYAHPEESLAELAVRAGVTKDVMSGRLRRLFTLAGQPCPSSRAGQPLVPDWTVHPGAFIEKLLDSRDITEHEFAMGTGLARERIAAILDGTAGIDEDAAGRIGWIFPPASSWLDYQAGYDADIARGVTSVLTGRGQRHPDELQPAPASTRGGI